MSVEKKRKGSAFAAFVVSLVLLGYFGLSAQWSAGGRNRLTAFVHYVSSNDTVIPLLQTSNTKRIILEHADMIRYDNNLLPGIQCLIGSVRLRHDNAVMDCDSAYLNEEMQTFEAFGAVHMNQADTVNMYGKYLYYDGIERLAKIRENVRLENRSTTLYTDSLDYDRNENLAYYFNGGTIVDSLNTLSSDYGQYNPTTDDAEFRDNVKLVNEKYTLNSEHLFYNTQTQVSIFDGPTTVVSDSNRIESTHGIYDSKNQIAILLDRSHVYSGSKSLVGDSIYYNQALQYGEAFGNMCITDSVKKADLYGDYGYYDESKNYAFACSRAYIKDYSNEDAPLYVGADSLELISLQTDTLKRYFTKPMSAEVYAMAKDSANMKKDDAEKGGEGLAGANLEQDNIPDTLNVPDEFYSDKLVRVDTAAIEDRPKELVSRIIKAYPKVKVYRKDLQAVCGYAQMVSVDSVLTMQRNPIMWSDNNQVLGDTIRFFFRNESLDHVDVYENGFVTQKLTETQYDQVKAPYFVAYMQDTTIREIRAYLDVMSIRYAKEEESDDYYGLNRLESKGMKLFFDKGQFQRAVFKGPSSGKFFPIAMGQTEEVNRLQGFNWSDQLRPKSAQDVIPTDSIPNAGEDKSSLMRAMAISGANAAVRAYEQVYTEIDHKKKEDAARMAKEDANMFPYLLKKSLELKNKPRDYNREIQFIPWYKAFSNRDQSGNSTTNPFTGILKRKD